MTHISIDAILSTLKVKIMTAFNPCLQEFYAHFAQGKRVFIKDILHYLLPPDATQPQIAPSLDSPRRGIGTDKATNGVNGTTSSSAPFPYHTHTEPGNPTVVPQSLLEKFHFTFLIRDPHSSIPSYFRCTLPPLVEMTGWDDFYPNEAGYDELRRFFDYMRKSGQVGPAFERRKCSCGDKRKWSCYQW